MQMTLPLREMRAALRTLRPGQPFDLNRMLASWVGLGYEAAAVVDAPGQFSRRGGIVDIWPPNLRKPLRIELFGDEVDSLRTFDPSTQRTLARVMEAWIGPASEALPKIGERVAEKLRTLDLAACHPPARIEFEREIEQLVSGSGCRNLEWYIPYLYSQPGCLTDYLPAAANPWLIVEDAGELMAALSDLEGQAEQLARDLHAAGDVPAVLARPYLAAEVLRERLSAHPALFLGHSTFGRIAPQQTDPLADAFAAGPRYGGQMRTILAEVESRLAGGDRVVMVSRQAPRLADLLGEAGHAVVPASDVPTLPPPGLTLVQGVMDEGWKLRVEAGSGNGTRSLAPSPQSPTLWFLTDAELFGWGKPKPRRPQRTRAMAPEVFFADVQPGDFVVHIEHGIGRFHGLIKMPVDGTEREYLQVEYAQGDQLYVPVHQADRLARYVGAGEAIPSLHRLGTAEWEQVKQRARRAVAEIADDLLELYAAREVVQGHAFSPDAAWQHELEASFPYVETEDQLVAIEAVKQDMEQARPMDRLICGDVGYGKTEVALRAAFKAIMDSKQVAILVPTTVLAQQHYTNFSRRLAAFPVSVAMLSRFQTSAQQDRVLSGLANGSVDLVIGTHRLLSNDVAVKDLGLLIVDEEQRFGVAHKERIKQLRTEVDVLTLTATPIPRTLHMSLTGVRDLSTIDTPPEERLPIKTFVGDFDETLVRQAILRETRPQRPDLLRPQPRPGHRADRGQARQDRARGAHRHRARPDARAGAVGGDAGVRRGRLRRAGVHQHHRERAGHPQRQHHHHQPRRHVRPGAALPVARPRRPVGGARLRLHAGGQVQGVERGRPPPAGGDPGGQRAGRGLPHRHARPGDSRRGRAAWLTPARPHRRGRVRSLHAAVGAGGERGAGECGRRTGIRTKMTQAETGVRGQEGGRHSLMEDPLAPTVTLDLNLPARIPESYVPEAALRLQLYRRLAGLTALDAVDELAQEFADRFGPTPEEVRNLLFVVQIKVLAINAGVEAIGFEEGQLLIKCAAPGDDGSERASRTAEEPGRAGPRRAPRHLAGDARGSRMARRRGEDAGGDTRLTRPVIPRPDLDQIAFQVSDHRRVHAPRLVAWRIDRLRGRDHLCVHPIRVGGGRQVDGQLEGAVQPGGGVGLEPQQVIAHVWLSPAPRACPRRGRARR